MKRNKQHNLQVFQNNEFGQVRTLIIENEPWFVGKDVCVAFGDKNHNRSLSRVDGVDKRTKEITDSLGRKQTAIFINESGLYSLLLLCNHKRQIKMGCQMRTPPKFKKGLIKYIVLNAGSQVKFFRQSGNTEYMPRSKP